MPRDSTAGMVDERRSKPSVQIYSPRSRPTEFRYAVSIRGHGKSVTVTHQCSGQHTLSWPAVACGATALRAGSTCLYTYPAIARDDGDDADATEAELGLVDQLIMHLATEAGYAKAVDSFMSAADGAGANPLHALLVSNQERSLNLVLSVFGARPDLLPLAHVGQPFAGENALHVLAVNRREHELCHLIELAAASLDRAELEALFHSQARGVFFTSPPMCFYGGSVLGYAVAFSLRRAVATMLRLSGAGGEGAMVGLLDLNDPKQACEQTGMLPLHVAVANGLARMHDFLTELPSLPEGRALRATREGLSERAKVSSLAKLDLAGLTPLQLAAKLGDRRMFQHIMRKRAKVLWVWGPVTEYQVSIEGIDSLGEGNNDVMEVVCQLDASKSTQAMLAPDFMQSFLFDLYLQVTSPHHLTSPLTPLLTSPHLHLTSSTSTCRSGAATAGACGSSSLYSTSSTSASSPHSPSQ